MMIPLLHFSVFAIRRSLEENWHWVMTIIAAIWVLPETMRTLFFCFACFPPTYSLARAVPGFMFSYFRRRRFPDESSR